LKEESFSELKVHKVRKSIKSKEDFQLAAKWPQYSRPENFMGMKVPKVLLSGNHEEIKKWRLSRKS
jgi:tRNA (guanine37-N1)-methyltransferase